MRALCLLRETPHYRRDAFCSGLKAAGFQIVTHIPDPKPDDVLVIWNRYTGYAEHAGRFESAGARVLVAENGYLGKDWRGGHWYSLAIGHHAGAGKWVEGGPQRWDSWGVELLPWREGGRETLIFGQRGIGEEGIASPANWANEAQRLTGGRIRPHPGKEPPAVSLERDLWKVREVVTWHSGAALLALMAGVPVWYGFPDWIGAQAGLPLAQFGKVPAKRDDADRLAMFRRLAWAMWEVDEIHSGAAIKHLLSEVLA